MRLLITDTESELQLQHRAEKLESPISTGWPAGNGWYCYEAGSLLCNMVLGQELWRSKKNRRRWLLDVEDIAVWETKGRG